MKNIKETIQTELMSVRRGEVDLEAIFNMSRRSTNVFTEPPSSPTKNNKKSVLSFAMSPFQSTRTADTGLGTTQQTDASSSPTVQSSSRRVLRGSDTTGDRDAGILLTPRKLLALDHFNEKKIGTSPVAGMPSPPMLLSDDMFTDDGMDNKDKNFVDDDDDCVCPVEEEDIDDLCGSSVPISGLDTHSAATAEAEAAELALSSPPTMAHRYRLYERLQQEQIRRNRIRNHISEVQQAQQ